MSVANYRRGIPLFSNDNDISLTAANAGTLLDNSKWTAPRTYTLPYGQFPSAGFCKPGDVFEVDVVAANQMTLSAGPSGVFILNGVAGQPGQTLKNATPGESCQLLNVAANTWRVRNVVGSHWVVS